jgi:DNA-directed RNA polymerase subunit RPC12/RpoP
MAQITAAAINKKFKINEIRELICSLIDRPRSRTKLDLAEQLRSKLEESNYNGCLDYDEIIEFGQELVRIRHERHRVVNYSIPVQIEEIETPVIQPTHSNWCKHSSDYVDSCPICLEVPSNIVFKCDKCNHEICSDCMIDWIHSDDTNHGLHSNCPYCGLKLCV